MSLLRPLDQQFLFGQGLRFAGFACLAALLSGCGHPKDAELLSRLENNRSELRTVMEMLIEDELMRVGRGDAWAYADGPPNAPMRQAVKVHLPNGRIEEYDRLIQNSRLEWVTMTREDPRLVTYYVSCFGVIGSSSCKGICYSEEELSPTVDSLDGLRGASDYYRKLDGNWYLFLFGE